MWDGLGMLLSLGGIMALASFLAGSLPLSFSLTQRQMRIISAIGTGLLIGTALIVIIPEGIETMYTSSSSGSQTPTLHAVEAAQRGGIAALALHGMTQHQPETAGRLDEIAGFARKRSVFVRAAAAQTKEHAHEGGETSHHAWIGVTLITGFIMMYLVDSLSTTHSHHAHSHHIPLTQLDSPSTTSPNDPSPEGKSYSKSTTIGLVIHSFADGIALGASSATPSTQTTLGVIVFVAILVHKAPAAFGLTAVLLKQGLGKRATRGHLLLFSLAAPVGAIATWSAVNLLGGSGFAAEQADAAWWTGLVLVFSGGTFLYVAMHAMQETTHSSRTDYASLGKSRTEVWLMVVGMLLPLLTQVGHAHAHGS